MEILETIGNVGNAMEGNTKNRVVPCLYWCFTLNNWTKKEMETLETNFKESGCKYLFSEEVGESGTPHLQGYIQSPVKIRASEKFKNDRIHWEKANGSKLKNDLYCSKQGVEHTNMNVTRDPIMGKELYWWQKDIMEIVAKKPDDRKIYWYWEKKGCSGKTSLAKHLCLKYGAIYVSGKAADVKCAIAELVKAGKDVSSVIFGVPRTAEDYMSYAALEEVKDGIFFSGKYESGMVIYNSPHVIVFANFAPDRKKLSEDRWVVVNIDEDPEGVYDPPTPELDEEYIE